MKLVGVTTAKKVIPITIGAIMAPNSMPNLNQSLFSGVSKFEFIKPKIKKVRENKNGMTFIWDKSPR